MSTGRAGARRSRAAVGKHWPRGDAVPAPRMEGAGSGCRQRCPPCPGSGASCQHPAGPDCGAVASAAGPRVLPRQEGGGRLPAVTHAGLAGGPPWPPFCAGGAAEALRCWEGSGWSPGSSSQLQSWGCWVHSVGRGGLCLCVCVCTFPAPKGPWRPCLAPTSLLGATCSYFSSKC